MLWATRRRCTRNARRHGNRLGRPRRSPLRRQGLAQEGEEVLRLRRGAFRDMATAPQAPPPAVAWASGPQEGVNMDPKRAPPPQEPVVVAPLRLAAPMGCCLLLLVAWHVESKARALRRLRFR